MPQLKAAVADMLGHGVAVCRIFAVAGGPEQALTDLVDFAVSNMKLAPAAVSAADQLAEAWATQLALAGDAVFAYRIGVTGSEPGLVHRSAVYPPELHLLVVRLRLNTTLRADPGVRVKPLDRG